MTTNLSQENVTLLEKNSKQMVNNFFKIVSWLKHGAESEHALPPAIVAFLDRFTGVEASVTELHGLVTRLNETLAQREQAYAEVSKRVVAL